MRKQQGLSLVELMIAIALGIVLMAGVIQVFISSKTVFSTQQGMSRIQESGRLAMELLAKDIRMAGFKGCIGRDSTKIFNFLNNSNDFKYNMDVGVQGYAGAPPGIVLNPEPLADTDVLFVRTASANTTTVSAHTSDAEIVITNTGEIENACDDDESSFSGFCKGDILTVSDCAKSVTFQASNIQSGGAGVVISHDGSGTPGNATTNWGGAADLIVKAFGPGAEILRTQYSVYYVGTSQVTGQPALFQFNSGANASFELLEGVENMRLTYSLFSAPDNFQIATDLPADAWTSDDDPVVAVRIELLVRSMDDGVLAETQPYTFAEVEVNPDDRRMRQVFTNTVGIRSRLP